MTQFKVASIFSNNMVLQRDKNIKIFGHGEEGQIVTVHFAGRDYQTRVKAGAWFVILPPMAAGTGYEMTVTCMENEKHFSNIAIGEVWLAGGQSNMEYELQNCTYGKEMLLNAENPNVRFYYTQKNAFKNEHFYEAEENSTWSEFNEENAKVWSAVGYIFGKRLAKEIGVTVGIIGCNWGGTSASCWMSEQSLSEDKDTSSYLEEYCEAVIGKSEEEQAREYSQYEVDLVEWNKKCAEQYANNPKISWEKVQKNIGPSKWPGPMGFMHPFRPSGLYHCMLERIMPFTLRGFIYYQGESDDMKPVIYQKLLTRMIRLWRDDWEDQTLPFLFVQLPMHRYEYDKDLKHWCYLRESQMNTFQTVKNTGIAVILDCGEFNEIHPKDKIPVGERLALQAMYQVYHLRNEKEAFGPIYKTFEYKEGGIELCFDYAEEGLCIKGEASGFEIAGEDGNFVNAETEIRGSKIFLSSPEIINPVSARYCWTNYGDVTIFGMNGLPLAPFRMNYSPSKAPEMSKTMSLYE